MDMMMPANKTLGENKTTAWEAGGCSSKAKLNRDNDDGDGGGDVPYSENN